MFSSMTNFLKSNFVSVFLFLFALLYGAFSRVVGMIFYTQFLGDQVRDQYVIAGITKGILPHLGPQSSIGLYSIPPLYYYLSSIFAFFDPSNPNLAIASNALCSFLEIFLFGFLIFRLLKYFSLRLRLLGASLGCALWSVFFVDILLNAQEWNPSSLNFFLFGFILVFDKIFDCSSKYAFAWWIIQGLILSIIVSLHSSGLFIFPFVYLLCSLFFIYLRPKYWYLPWLGFLSSLAFLTPYWLGEFSTRFANTKLLLKTLINKSGESHGFLNRIEQSIKSLANFGDEAYFVGLHTPFLFLVCILSCGLIVFRYRKMLSSRLLALYSLVILVFGVAISSYDGVVYAHYAVVGWSFGLIVPILALIITISKIKWQELLENLNPAKKVQVWLAKITLPLFVLSVICVLFITNLNASNQLIVTKIGRERLPNTADYAKVVDQLPANTILCSHSDQIPAFQYFASVQNKQIKTQNLDEAGCRFSVIPKFRIENRILRPNTLSTTKATTWENEAILIYAN